jgi:glycosyltransferase involved in cell wall biosynthesis
MGANVGHKQPQIAAQVAQQASREIVFIGPGFWDVDESYKWDILGGAYGLLCPYTIDASPRAPLEAAACGTPTLCFASDGTHEHVKDGISGFICHGIDDMVRYVRDLNKLDPLKMRAWVTAEHDHKATIAELEAQLLAIVNGERW